MKKKYLFISNMAAPYQIKFCDSLQKYYNAEFWFYEYVDKTRPNWWKIPLGENCKIIEGTKIIPGIGYVSIKLLFDLIKFRPNIIVLGGFMKWHIIVLLLCKILGAKVAIMSEPLRNISDDDSASTELVSREKNKFKIKLYRLFFKSADLYIGMGEIAKKQFIEEFKFPLKKVRNLLYPQDIEEYYSHPLRDKKKGDEITILFANRLVERYQPLMALEILEKLSKKYSNIKMLMNSEGSQKEKCIEYIQKNNLENIEFLDKIDSWNKMHLIYKKSDILILPCVYSNGNGTIIEAKASGMGMVLSNQINNIEKHSQNEKNCFICDLDVDKFVEMISIYIENPLLLKKHGLEGRKSVEFRKNENIAKNYFDEFEK